MARTLALAGEDGTVRLLETAARQGAWPLRRARRRGRGPVVCAGRPPSGLGQPRYDHPRLGRDRPAPGRASAAGAAVGQGVGETLGRFGRGRRRAGRTGHLDAGGASGSGRALSDENICELRQWMPRLVGPGSATPPRPRRRCLRRPRQSQGGVGAVGRGCGAGLASGSGQVAQPGDAPKPGATSEGGGSASSEHPPANRCAGCAPWRCWNTSAPARHARRSRL